jgi:hypothetical protein
MSLDPSSERRREERSRLPMAVKCSLAARKSQELSLVEASLTGCRVKAAPGLLARDQHILITPPGMHGLAGIVRWVVGDGAGIEFDQPLAAVVLRHLLYEPQDGDDERWDFVDGFGRRLPQPPGARFTR